MSNTLLHLRKAILPLKRLFMDYAVLQFGEFGAVPAVCRTYQVTCNPLERVDVGSDDIGAGNRRSEVGEFDIHG